MGDLKPTIADVDRSFHDTAVRALNEHGTTALQFLDQHPDYSLIDLAKCLNRGASAIGLVMVIYEESELAGKTRDVARNLLYREIISEFPEGWFEEAKIRAAVKLGSWHSHIGQYTRDFGGFAAEVLKEVTMRNVPPTGWKPQSPDDDRIRAAFDNCWPVTPD
jgi:hypothetical protein